MPEEQRITFRIAVTIARPVSANSKDISEEIQQVIEGIEGVEEVKEINWRRESGAD